MIVLVTDTLDDDDDEVLWALAEQVSSFVLISILILFSLIL